MITNQSVKELELSPPDATTDLPARVNGAPTTSGPMSNAKPRRMRVLILGLNYLPESTSIGPYTADLAEFLQARGHDVRVVTGFPSAPQWRIWDGYRGKLFMREKVNGVSVTRTYLYIPKNPKKALQRILFDCSFAVSGFLGALFLSLIHI